MIQLTFRLLATFSSLETITVREILAFSGQSERVRIRIQVQDYLVDLTVNGS
jgi:hypothetical protein